MRLKEGIIGLADNLIITGNETHTGKEDYYSQVRGTALFS